jgi:hypothetical protein
MRIARVRNVRVWAACVSRESGRTIESKSFESREAALAFNGEVASDDPDLAAPLYVVALKLAADVN